jgi:hypothetical protein
MVVNEQLRSALQKLLVLYAPTVAAQVWAAIAALPADADDHIAVQVVTPLINAAGAELQAAEDRFDNETCWAETSRIKH